MKNILKKTDFWVGLISLLLGIFVFSVTFTFKQTLITDNFLGATFFPRIISVVMMLLSIALLWSTFTAVKNSSEDEPAGDNSTAFTIERMKRPFSVIFCLAVYYFLLRLSGFCITSTLLFWAMLFIIKAEKKKFYVIAPVFVVIVYAVFRYLFLVQLPTGIVGF